MDTIQETDIQILKQCCNEIFIGNDLILIDDIQRIPLPNSPRRTNFIMIGLCIEGNAKYSVDIRDYEVKKREVFLVSERHTIDKICLSPDFKALCMIVSISFFHEIIRNVSEMSALFFYSRNHPVMPFNEKQKNVFISYFEVIRSKITEKTNHFQKELIRTLMLAMFYDLSNVIYRTRQCNKKSVSRSESIFTGFIKLVEENCKTERRVRWYAKQLGISPKYLSEIIKHVSHRTPNEWLDNYVTLEIRVQLKNTTKSIKQIAHEMNFPNQSFMGKYFKEVVGMSPLKYRKS